MCKIIKLDENYYLKIKRESQIDEVLRQVKEKTKMRKGSFADKYVAKIMTGILHGAVDLRVRYERYYAEEYRSFEDYLYNKELFDSDKIEELALQENETLFSLYLSNNDYSITSIIGYEDENLPVINQLIGAALHEI